LGEIPQVNKTFNVIGNGNCQGLVIGESTFGGVEQLSKQSGAIIDYGSMIYLTLQRASTAREAIQTMSDLMDTYGYYSEGESISIADSTTGEVWIMEVIGRGDSNGKKGAVWVAQKVPDGMITAHANQARITTFPRDDPDNCLYAPDVVEVAVHYGLYPSDKDPLEFSFSDVFDPVAFTNARFSEARVWSIFSQAADEDGSFQLQYQDYASGRDLKSRMPLFIKPHKKLSAFDVMNLMNSHYEGTELDGTLDTGGGVFGDPHRPRPLTWEYEGKTYFNERTVAIERTGWNFVAQLRPHMPRELSVLIWFASDDTSTSPRVPVYACSTTVAEPYSGKGTQDGVPAPMMKLDLTKAFWVQNMVSNLAYGRWKDAYPIVRQKIDNVHFDFVRKIRATDVTAEAIYNSGSPEEAVKYATQVSVKMAEILHRQWMDFYGELFVRFRDFSTIVADKENTRCGCDVQEPGIADEVKRRIVMETGEHYEVKDDGAEGPTSRIGSPDIGTASFRRIKSVH
jgi:dipeptidase